MLRKTEYQSNFGKIGKDVAEVCYLEMFNYRKKKKEREIRHTPVVWLDDYSLVSNGQIASPSSEEENPSQRHMDASIITSRRSSASSIYTPTTNTKDAAVQVPFKLLQKQCSKLIPHPRLLTKNSHQKTKKRDVASQSSPIRLKLQNEILDDRTKNGLFPLCHCPPVKLCGLANNCPRVNVRPIAIKPVKIVELNRKQRRRTPEQRMKHEKLRKEIMKRNNEAAPPFVKWKTEYLSQFCN